MAKKGLESFYVDKDDVGEDLQAFFKALKGRRGKDGATPTIDYPRIVAEVLSKIKIPKPEKAFDGITPRKYVDYFTKAEVAEFLKKVTPIKGIHYEDGKDGDPQKILPQVFKKIQEELSKIKIEPKDTAEELAEKINGVKGKIKLDAIEKIGELVAEVQSLSLNQKNMRKSISMAGQNSLRLKNAGSLVGLIETLNIIGATIATDSSGREATVTFTGGSAGIHTYATSGDFPATGVADNLYIAEDTDFLYYWNGSAYVQLAGGGGSGDTFYDNETPSGTINGSNATFTLAHSPSGSSLKLFLNGMFLTAGVDYTLSGDTITFTTAPEAEFSGLPFKAFYRTTSVASYSDNETPAGSINGSNATFTLAQSPTAASLLLYLNGMMLTQGVDYTLSGSTITFTTAPAAEFSGLPFKAFYRY